MVLMVLYELKVQLFNIHLEPKIVSNVGLSLDFCGESKSYASELDGLIVLINLLIFNL